MDPFELQRHSDDVDSSVFAQHHTLGPKAHQAAPGNHYHGDGSSGGTVQVGGAWAAGAPPNGTTGVQFVISKPGTYLLETVGTGYSVGGGVLATMTDWIDGANAGWKNFYINPANTHMCLGRHSWTQKLLAGTHYWYIQYSQASDANDMADLTWKLI